MSGAPGQKGFQLDVGLCTGCGACAVACAIENELPWGTSWRWIETFNADRVPEVPLHHLSLACNHCADAPCMQHCPALAYTKDPTTGAVLLNEDHCIGCRYCTWACPYDAPRYRADLGIVSKCTFCHERQLEGFAPACVSQCPTGALRFGDVDVLEGVPRIAGFPRTEAEPSIRFVRAGGRRPPGLAAIPQRDPPPVDAASVGPPEGGTPGRPETAGWTAPQAGGSSGVLPLAAGGSKTSLASEWPLVVFTLTCAALAGMMAAPAGRRMLTLPSFLAAAALAAGASTLHLGRRLRAWRAVLNVRRSWLSREVALFGSFAGVSAWHLSGSGAPSWSAPLAGILGLALLYAVDRVYAVTGTRGLPLHSARVLLTGVAVAALTAGLPSLFAGAALLKGVQYGRRSLRLGGRAGKRPAVAVLRLASLLLAAAIVLTPRGSAGVGGPAWLPFSWEGVAWVAFALGEVVDRVEFYLDLTVSTPARQIEYDLAVARARVGVERCGRAGQA